MPDVVLDIPDVLLSKVIHHIIDWSKIDDNSIIVDAGSSNGDSIMIFREHTNCLICAIEPNRDLFLQMIEELFMPGKLQGINKNFLFSNKALVGNSYSDFINFYQFSKASSIIKDLYKDSDGKIIPCYVRTIKIGDLFNEFGIQKIDYLKLNIVGAEQDVIKDMPQETANKIIQISVHIYYQQQSYDKGLIDVADDRLKTLGYQTKRFYDGMEIYAHRNGVI